MDAEYEEKALKSAAHAQLSPDADLKNLTTRMHVSRGGPLEPFGNELDVSSETKQGLDQRTRWFESAPIDCGRWMAVRMGARMNIGIAPMSSIFASVPTLFGSCCLVGRADEYWHRARGV